MAGSSSSSDDVYGRLITDRVNSLERVFGKHEDYLVSPLPFYMGGNPTIVSFPHAVPNAVVFCTSEMTGGWGSKQLHGLHGEYEFAIVVPSSGPLTPRATNDGLYDIGPAVSVLHDLAKHSLVAELLPGQTIGPLDPSLQPMTTAVFIDLTTAKNPFEVYGKVYGLTLIYFISHAEWELHRRVGHKEFVRRLRASGSFPISSLERPHLT